jgi:hypothetical protein
VWLGTFGAAGTKYVGRLRRPGGASTWLFEVDDDMRPVRQIEIYDNGSLLRHGPGHLEDGYGQLGYDALGDPDEWSQWAISAEEFEHAWSNS